MDFSTQGSQESSRARTFGSQDLRRRARERARAPTSTTRCHGRLPRINEDGLRFRDSFVRHKILWTRSAISTCWERGCWRVLGFKSGHKLNNYAARTARGPEAYEPSSREEGSNPRSTS